MGRQSNNDKLDMEIAKTVMAIRERVVEYYKGSCVDRLTDRRIDLVGESRGTLGINPRQFERLLWQQEDSKLLLLDSVNLLTLRRQPDTLILGLNLERSKEMRGVKVGIKNFMGKYLPNVKVHDEEFDDKKLVAPTERNQVRRPAATALQMDSVQQRYYDLVMEQNATRGIDFSPAEAFYTEYVPTSNASIQWTTDPIEPDLPF